MKKTRAGQAGHCRLLSLQQLRMAQHCLGLRRSRRSRHRAAIQESIARSDLFEVAPEKRPSRGTAQRRRHASLRALRRGERFALLVDLTIRRNCQPWRLSASGSNAALPLLTCGCTSARARRSSTSTASRCPAGVTAWFFIPGLNFPRTLRSRKWRKLAGTSSSRLSGKIPPRGSGCTSIFVTARWRRIWRRIHSTRIFRRISSAVSMKARANFRR